MIKFDLDPELRKYLEYVQNSFLQLNTNHLVERIGSRGLILADAIKDLTKILNREDVEPFPEMTWSEGYFRHENSF